MSEATGTNLLNRPYPMRTLLKIVITATLSCFVTGYNIGVTNSSLPNVEHFLNSSLSSTVFSSIHGGVFAIGGTIGSIISGKLANHYGRRKGMIILCFLTFLTCGITIIPTIATFFIGRFMAGITAGIGISIPPMYISEIVPKAISGKLGSLIQFTLTFGILASYLLCLMLPVYRLGDWTNDLWFLIYAFPSVPAAVQLAILVIVYDFDTPRWLETVSRENEIEIMLRRIYGGNWEDFRERTDQGTISNPSYSEIFFQARYRKPLLVGCVLSISQQLMGINAFIFYSGVIFSQLQGDSNFANMFTAAIGFVNMASTMICLTLIEKYGRKSLMIQGTLGMGICHLILFLFNIVGLPSAAGLPFIFVYIAFFESSSGPVLWIYCGDTLTDRGIGLAVSMNWFFSGVVTALFNPLVEILTIKYIFLIFSAFCFASFAFVLVFMIETKGRAREQLVSADS